MQVKELMQQAVIIDANMTLAEAAKVMSERRIGSLLIVSDSKLKGIITERDVLKNFGKSAKVEQAMSPKVTTIAPKERVSKALELMKENKVKRLAVVQSDKLVGVISLTDIAAHVDELEGDFFFDSP